MKSFAVLSRPLSMDPRRRISFLTALAGALLVAFFIAPNALARSSVNTANVGDSFRHGFAAYWASGSEDFPALLGTTVNYWFRFHLVKAGVSALLLAVTVALGVVLWRHGRQRTGRRYGRLPLTWADFLVGVLGIFALVALMANLQGAAAPFASLLPMLTTGGADGELTRSLAQARQQLAVYPDGQHSPALSVMISDFAVYHAVFAVMAAVLALAMAGVTVMLWRQRKNSPERRSGRATKFGVTASAVLTAAALVVAVANTTSAADSPRALAGFFAGGW
ncbi:tat (twin-arginine translocation) pathway signal sequence [Streptomyces sp. NPDC006012]|uniref:tat (twin-arginine translocation) pathway signal sequence n=1 Tax=Streptomyces sp. NPDC006012 TaxID=3364739 RepID=UPI0036B7D1E0